MPLGFRHYMFLNAKSKIFVNLQYAFFIPMSSQVQLLKADRSVINPPLEMKFDHGLAIGAGYNFNNKYGFEIKYYLGRNFLHQYSNWNSNLNTISLALSYTILSSKLISDRIFSRWMSFSRLIRFVLRNPMLAHLITNACASIT